MNKITIVEEGTILYEFEHATGWKNAGRGYTKGVLYSLSRPDYTLQHEQDFMYRVYPDNHDHVTTSLDSLKTIKATNGQVGTEGAENYEVSLGEIMKWLFLNGLMHDEGNGEYLIES